MDQNAPDGSNPEHRLGNFAFPNGSGVDGGGFDFQFRTMENNIEYNQEYIIRKEASNGDILWGVRFSNTFYANGGNPKSAITYAYCSYRKAGSPGVSSIQLSLGGLVSPFGFCDTSSGSDSAAPFVYTSSVYGYNIRMGCYYNYIAKTLTARAVYRACVGGAYQYVEAKETQTVGDLDPRYFTDDVGDILIGSVNRYANYVVDDVNFYSGVLTDSHFTNFQSLLSPYYGAAESSSMYAMAKMQITPGSALTGNRLVLLPNVAFSLGNQVLSFAPYPYSFFVQPDQVFVEWRVVGGCSVSEFSPGPYEVNPDLTISAPGSYVLQLAVMYAGTCSQYDIDVEVGDVAVETLDLTLPGLQPETGIWRSYSGQRLVATAESYGYPRPLIEISALVLTLVTNGTSANSSFSQTLRWALEAEEDGGAGLSPRQSEDGSSELIWQQVASFYAGAEAEFQVLLPPGIYTGRVVARNVPEGLGLQELFWSPAGPSSSPANLTFVVTEPPEESDDGGADSLLGDPAFLGGLSGGVALLLCLGLLALCCCAAALLLCVLLLVVFVLLAVIVCAVVIVALLAAAGAIGAKVATRGTRRKKVDLQKLLQQYEEQVGAASFRELDIADISFGRKVGEGAFGTVCVGEWRGIEVAVKTLHAKNFNTDTLGEFRHECEIMQKIGNHANLVTFIGAVTTGEQYLIVTEYCSRGSLLSILECQGIVSEQDMLFYARDAARGLAHLHAEGVVHRDIAARNCLVTHDWSLKVSDFGTARIASKHDEEGSNVTSSNIGPVRWMAPECLKSQKYSIFSDSWAFGVLLFEISTGGRYPYEDLGVLDVAVAVGREGRIPEIPEDAPDVFKEVMSRVFVSDPRSRLKLGVIARMICEELGEAESFDDAESDFANSMSSGFAMNTYTDASAASSREQTQTMHDSESSNSYVPFTGGDV